jgi:hypothetical protein
MITSFAVGFVMFFVGLVRSVLWLCRGLVTVALGFVCLAMLLVAVSCFVGSALTHTHSLGTGVVYLMYAGVAFALIVALHSMRAQNTMRLDVARDASFNG